MEATAAIEIKSPAKAPNIAGPTFAQGGVLTSPIMKPAALNSTGP